MDPATRALVIYDQDTEILQLFARCSAIDYIDVLVLITQGGDRSLPSSLAQLIGDCLPIDVVFPQRCRAFI
jgi:hypothetical protein